MAAFLFCEMMVRMALLLWLIPCQNQILEITWGSDNAPHVKTHFRE